MKATFFTLGCKVNQYETQILKQMFIKDGFDILDQNNKIPANIYVINSCTVTSESEKKTKQLINKLKINNPDAIIILTGCLPQAFPQKAKEIPNVDVIIGNKNKLQILNFIKKYIEDKKRIVKIEKLDKNEIYNSSINSGLKVSNRTRAFIKIQDGCNRFCSYCIIPIARGNSRSKNLKDLKTEIDNVANHGFKEVVLVGINLFLYGKDINCKFIDAIELVCTNEKIKRVRIGSLEPEVISVNTLTRLARIEKFCPQFHISLQSGSDEILKAMNRHYTTEEYYNAVNDIKNNIKNSSITTDIIAGFPGETEPDFEKTLRFIEKVEFSKVHVFPYSKREGTKAYDMPNQIAKCTKKQRVKEILKIANKVRAKFIYNMTGNVEPVLFEGQIENNTYKGYTKNYVSVIVKSENNISNEILNVQIKNTHADYCTGSLV